MEGGRKQKGYCCCSLLDTFKTFNASRKLSSGGDQFSFASVFWPTLWDLQACQHWAPDERLQLPAPRDILRYGTLLLSAIAPTGSSKTFSWTKRNEKLMLIVNLNQPNKNTPRKRNFWQRKPAGAFIVLIKDTARSFFSWPDERQAKRNMKQLTVQDRVKHMELLKVFAVVQEMEKAWISNFKTEGKGLFLQPADYSLETRGLPPNDEKNSKIQGLLTKEWPVHRAKHLPRSRSNSSLLGHLRFLRQKAEEHPRS